MACLDEGLPLSCSKSGLTSCKAMKTCNAAVHPVCEVLSELVLGMCGGLLPVLAVVVYPGAICTNLQPAQLVS